MNIHIKLFFFSSLLIFLCLPSTSLAANTDLSFSGPHTTAVGQTIRIRALVSSKQSLNATQGTIQYPKSILAVTGIITGKSIIKYWQQEPNNDPGTGTISFTGGLPNPGYSGSGGVLFDISMRALAEGKATVTFGENTQILANDGNGSALDTSKQGITIQITKALTPPPGTNTPPAEPIKDTTPPTNLELLIGHDGNLFNGDWFAVFQATDSESGIDHYEIAEVPEKTSYPTDNEWIKATSPYRLQEQGTNTKIFFKAIDKAGNQSVISHDHIVKPPLLQIVTAPTDWRLLIILAIILLLGVVLPIFVYRRKKQQTNAVQK